MAQIKKSARDFESVFCDPDADSRCTKGSEVDPTFGGGHGEEMFRTMLLDQYGKQMAANDSLGIVQTRSAGMLLNIQEGKH